MREPFRNIRAGIRRATARLHRFGRDAHGSLSVETVLVAPLLFLVMALLYSGYDLFRYQASNGKAAYTLGDLLSRETDAIDQSYIDGMKGIYDYITMIPPERTWLRVSVVHYDSRAAAFKLDWSHASAGVTPLTQVTLASVADLIPEMSGGDAAIIVETHTTYQVPFRVGIASPFEFYEFIVTRPRFADQLLWAGS